MEQFKLGEATMDPKISVIIPVYNTEPVAPQMFRQRN